MEASQQYVGQTIFSFAGDADEKGERTLGVLTKCDRMQVDETDALEAVRSRNLKVHAISTYPT